MTKLATASLSIQKTSIKGGNIDTRRLSWSTYLKMSKISILRLKTCCHVHIQTLKGCFWDPIVFFIVAYGLVGMEIILKLLPYAHGTIWKQRKKNRALCCSVNGALAFPCVSCLLLFSVVCFPFLVNYVDLSLIPQTPPRCIKCFVFNLSFPSVPPSLSLSGFSDFLVFCYPCVFFPPLFMDFSCFFENWLFLLCRFVCLFGQCSWFWHLPVSPLCESLLNLWIPLKEFIELLLLYLK